MALAQILTAKKRITASLASATAALDQDLRGVVAGLMTADPTGENLKRYLQALLRTDAGASMIGKQLAVLQGAGSGLDPVKFAKVETPVVEGPARYQNASSLGYYMGALLVAVARLNPGTENNKKIVRTILETSISMAYAAKDLAPARSSLLEKIRYEIENQQNGKYEVRRLLDDIPEPVYPNGDRFEGEAIIFVNYLSSTVRFPGRKMDYELPRRHQSNQ